MGRCSSGSHCCRRHCVPDDRTGTRPGDEVGPYRLERRLGSGGFGEVWLGRRTDQKPVAIKILATLGHDERSRFARELAILKRLQHPAIVRPLDAGEHHGRPFLVTEYVDGPELGAWLEVPRSIESLRSVARQIVDALATAHRAGVIHRDLKPANILLRDPESAEPQVCVLDFGIARMAGRELLDITVTGEVIGTPGYMSPEQLRGSKEIGPATDMYSLGVILFLMMQGRPPFGGPTALEVCMAHLTNPAPPVTRPDAQELAKLIERLLSKDPRERPTALALSRALSPHRRRPVEVRRERKPWGWAIAAVAIIVTLTALALWDRDTAEVPRVPAPNPLAAARVEQTAPPLTEAPAKIERAKCLGYKAFSPGPRNLGALGNGVLVHIPPEYDPSRSYPVVVFFHDAFQEPERALHNIDFSVEGANDYVWVFQPGNVNADKAHWLDPSLAEAALGTLAAVGDEVCVDLDRLFTVGHGEGGFAVQNLLLCARTPFRAAATFAFRERVRRNRCKPDIIETPMLAISPMEDPTAAPDKERRCDGRSRAPVAKQLKRSTTRNRCQLTTVPDRGCTDLKCESPLRWCQVGGSRQWRSEYNPFFRAALAANACPQPQATTFQVTREIIDFFARFTAEDP